MALSEKTKNTLSLLLRIGLSLLLLAYLFHKVDIAKMIATIKDADFKFIYLSSITFLIINFILLLRWTVFVRALGLMVPFKSVTNCFFIGLFFNLFLPSSTGGDIVKTVGLFKDTGEKAKVVASVVCDRLSGFVSIVLVALVAFLFGHRFIGDNSLLVSILILASISGSIVLVLFNEKLFSFSCRLFNRFPRIKNSLMNLHYAIVLLKKKPAALCSSVLLSSLSQAVLALTFYLVARSLHHDIKMIYFLTFVPLVCVIASLPSIGGLGVRDAGAVYLFTKVGVESSVILSVTLINFLFMVAVGLIGGVVYVVAMSPQRSKNQQLKAAMSPKNV